MSILAEKLQAALAAKQGGIVPSPEPAEPQPVRRTKTTKSGTTSKTILLLKFHGARGLTSGELAAELKIDIANASAVLAYLCGRCAYRQATDAHAGPGGGPRFRYFYMESKGVKPKQPKLNTVVSSPKVPTTWTADDADDTPIASLQPAFKLEIRRVYFMVLSNGKEVELTRDQFDALGGAV